MLGRNKILAQQKVIESMQPVQTELDLIETQIQEVALTTTDQDNRESLQRELSKQKGKFKDVCILYRRGMILF